MIKEAFTSSMCRHTWAYKYLGFTSSVLGAQLRLLSKKTPRIQTKRWNLRLVGILNRGVKRMIMWYRVYFAQLLCFDQFELEVNHADVFFSQVVDKEKRKPEGKTSETFYFCMFNICLTCSVLFFLEFCRVACLGHAGPDIISLKSLSQNLQFLCDYRR
jgi:hypothetical protein